MTNKFFITLCIIICSLNVFSQKNLQRNNLRTHEEKTKHEIKAPKIIGKEYVLLINNQTEFDNLASTIRLAIQKKQLNILVRIGPGTFYYKTGHINLNGINNPKLSIRIEGNKTRLIAKGRDYTPRENRHPSEVDYGHCILSDRFEYLNFDGEYSQLESLVEVVDEKNKTCRIRTDLPNQNGNGASIQLNEWYMVRTYPITKIKKGYLYFTATDLEYNKVRKCYNVNYDYAISKIMPRYAIKNLKNHAPFSINNNTINFPQGVRAIHECENSQFLILYKNNINYFHLNGIDFVGSSDKEQLLYVRYVKANKVMISNCTFRYIKSTILRYDYTDNLCFANNTIENCFGRGVWTTNGLYHTMIIGNKFYRTIKTIEQPACITCNCENYYIADNVFMDFGGIAISAGIKYTQKQTAPVSGIIENNEIYYTKDYHDFMEKFSLIDGGAIYLSSQHDETIVRYNYIHNYCGIDSRRSIYCDDGCYNVKIYGNLIYQPDNSNAVFSWLTSASKNNMKLNTGIDFMYNVIWGKYKFEEREHSNCVHGKNVIIYSKDRPLNVLKNFAHQEDDIFLKETLPMDETLRFSNETMRFIQSLPTYKGISKWLK